MDRAVPCREPLPPRSIPACAEPSPRHFTVDFPYKVYLRVCGAILAALPLGVERRGLSPRVRSHPRGAQGFLRYERSISACAEPSLRYFVRQGLPRFDKMTICPEKCNWNGTGDPGSVEAIRIECALPLRARAPTLPVTVASRATRPSPAPRDRLSAPPF